MLSSHDQTATVISPARWASVKTALIRSIRNGVFFDRKYWTRHSNVGDVLKPVYISSIIMDDKVNQLKKCTLGFVYVFTEVLMILSGGAP